METKLCFVTNNGASYKPILLNLEVYVLHHAIFASTVRPSTRNFKLNDLAHLCALCVRYRGAVLQTAVYLCGCCCLSRGAARPGKPCSPAASLLVRQW